MSVDKTPNGGMLVCRLSTLAAALLLLMVTAASAWENDFHYGLTKWLALQAGFGPEPAETIAVANVEADVGIEDARHLVFHYACFSRDPKASERVRDLHYPTFEPVPNPPGRRAVYAGSRAALHQTLKEIALPLAQNAPPQEQTHRLTSLGRALHPLQDSWSHQGVPDVPRVLFISCNDNLAWAHPKARGGWNSHVADHSHQWVQDAVLAAKETYKLLVEFLQKQGWARETVSKDWSTLEKYVVAWAQANTKMAKLDWFKARGLADLTYYLESTTLPDGKEPFFPVRLLQRAPRGVLPSAFKSVKVPSEVREVVKTLIESWVLRPDIEELIHKFVDSEAVAKELRIPPGWFQEMDKRTPARTVFGMWRIRDHGLVTALGHAIAREVPGGSSKENFQRLATIVMKDPEARLYFRSIDEALLAFGKDAATPFLILPTDTTERRYAVILRFKTAPLDVIKVGMQRVGGRWQAVSLSWALDH